MSWITIKTLNQHDPELDCLASIAIKNIMHIMDANRKDKQERQEAEAVVVCLGSCFCSPETRVEILNKIKEAEKDIPTNE